MDKILNSLEEYEVEYDDIVTSIINSIKANATDYCYTKKDMRDILSKAKALNLSMIYIAHTDKNNAVDYFKVIPAKFYEEKEGNIELIKGICCELDDIPNNLQCTVTKNGKLFMFKLLNSPISKKNIDWIKRN